MEVLCGKTQRELRTEAKEKQALDSEDFWQMKFLDLLQGRHGNRNRNGVRLECQEQMMNSINKTQLNPAWIGHITKTCKSKVDFHLTLTRI